jgi:hypothetical protein
MKPTNDQIAATRFVTRNRREKHALTEWTMGRLRQVDEDARRGRRPAPNTGGAREAEVCGGKI